MFTERELNRYDVLDMRDYTTPKERAEIAAAFDCPLDVVEIAAATTRDYDEFIECVMTWEPCYDDEF